MTDSAKPPVQQSAFDAQLQRLDREDEERAIARQAEAEGYGYIDIEHYPLNPDVLRRIPEERAREGMIMPFYQRGEQLKVAFTDANNPVAKEEVERLQAAGLTLQFYLCSVTGLLSALDFYAAGMLQKKQVRAKTTYTELENPTLAAHKEQFQQLEKQLGSVPLELSVSSLYLLSLSTKASDVHLQPYRDGLHVRFRIDGVLHEVLRVPASLAERFVRHIKYQAGMKSNITQMPQDGRSRFVANGREIDLRVSTLPTQYGESMVLRVLDPDKGIKSFAELGFSALVEEKITRVLQEVNGLILVTGPTGSGKTTTLYSMLQQLNTPDKKLLTLEDPIEYRLPGVTQSQVDERAEYNFATGLKALLRHDPDVILVGEIRTLATAKLATEASLTGHMVLSSLHTNSAIGAITRLQNMGLEDYNIAPSLRAVFAQRLVRRVCPVCSTTVPRPVDAPFTAAVRRLEAHYPSLQVPEEIPMAKGCSVCSETGYNGMIAICEAFVVEDTLREMLLQKKSSLEIQRYLVEETDYLTLAEDGVYKVLQGITTLEEVRRVTTVD